MASDILIVDDEADIRELVSGILMDEGHGTRTAADADSALAEQCDLRAADAQNRDDYQDQHHDDQREAALAAA